MHKSDKINKEVISNLNPCEDRFDSFLKHYSDFSDNLEAFISLDKITHKDKLWVLTKLFTKEQNIKFALKCAYSVLHIFETEYPEDKRPRNTLEAVENYLKDPSENNRNTAARAAANIGDVNNEEIEQQNKILQFALDILNESN